MNKFIILLLLVTVPLSAQDFGFGSFDDDNDGGGLVGNAVDVTIGGKVSASVLGFVDDFSEGADHTRLGDVFSGKLNFSAGTSFADGVINLKLQTTVQPISIDEAYIRAFFGGLEIEGGLRKLVWGRADSFGPLDVINPLNYTELTDLSDIMNLKIARPLIHASYRIGSFSKIEAVFVPWFEPLRYDMEGRWTPPQMAQLFQLESLGVPVHQPDLTTLEYAQAGMRFTTTIGSADLGFQYYYGRLTKPAVTMTLAPPSPVPEAIHFAYNPYHQIGVDWAQVLFGFNVRAEIAANITDDLGGDDGSVYNPSFLWSFGFDRDLFWAINLNFQVNESIILLHNKITNNPLPDIEADSDITSTQFIAALSRYFLRDKLKARVAFMWEIEARDFVLMPSLVYTRDTVSVELSGGIFGGNEDGQFGQYRNNNFVKVALSYSF